MNQTAQHIALMEALGWTKLDLPQSFRDKWWSGRLIGVPPENRGLSSETQLRELPPLSLDLMATAEATLTDRQRDDYIDRLHEILKIRTPDQDDSYSFRDLYRFITPTKEQRLEAYLKATGRWIKS